MPRLTEHAATAAATAYLAARGLDGSAPLSLAYCGPDYPERFAAELEAAGHAAETVAAVRRNPERLSRVWLVGYRRPRVGWWRCLVSILRGVPGGGRYVFLAVDDATGTVTRDL